MEKAGRKKESGSILRYVHDKCLHWFILHYSSVLWFKLVQLLGRGCAGFVDFSTSKSAKNCLYCQFEAGKWANCEFIALCEFFFLTYFCVNPYVQLKTNLFAFMGFSKLKPQCLKSFKNFYIDLFTKNFSTHRIIQATFQ